MTFRTIEPILVAFMSGLLDLDSYCTPKRTFSKKNRILKHFVLIVIEASQVPANNLNIKYKSMYSSLSIPENTLINKCVFPPSIICFSIFLVKYKPVVIRSCGLAIHCQLCRLVLLVSNTLIYGLQYLGFKGTLCCLGFLIE